MARRLSFALIALACSTACTMGPNYKRPDVVTNPAWRQIPIPEAQSVANTAWWDIFQDPKLQELVRTALQENRDLKIAVERIEEARARYGFTKTALYPSVDFKTLAGGLRSSAGSLLHTPDEENGGNSTTDVWSLSADMTWEIDLFGHLRRLNEAEKALFLGTEEARRSAVLALVSSVASAYLEMRDLDQRLEVARRSITVREQSLQVATDRFRGGLTSEVDMRQAESELHRVEAVTFDLERLIGLKENELSVLLGRNPGAIPRGLSIAAQTMPAAVPAGLPSDLLERRPDIREAEQRLVAATANIGAAKALLYPRIALTSSVGLATTDVTQLFDASSISWNILGSLLQPIFDAGRNKRRVQMTESQQRQTLYDYERTILQAFREVEDALIAYRKTDEQRQAESRRVTADRQVLELANLRYQGGVADYLEVLDAERSLFASELDETQAMGAHTVALVQLYKALGGGWQTEVRSVEIK